MCNYLLLLVYVLVNAVFMNDLFGRQNIIFYVINLFVITIFLGPKD